jgi:hypothetical protein
MKLGVKINIWTKFHIFPEPLDILFESIKVSTTFIFPEF